MSTKEEGLAAVAAAAAMPRAESAPELAAQPAAPDADAIRQEAATAERKRLLSIDALTLAGCEAVAVTAKESGQSLEEFAVAQCEHIKASGALDAVAKMAAAAETVPPIDNAATDPVGAAKAALPDNATPEQRAEHQWENDPAVRAEFASVDDYKAYVAAESRGVIRNVKAA